MEAVASVLGALKYTTAIMCADKSPGHTKQTFSNNRVHANVGSCQLSNLTGRLKTESEENIYCNLEKLLLLLCLTEARRLQTRKKRHHHRPNFKHRQTQIEHVESDQTSPNKHRQPWLTKQTSVSVGECLPGVPWAKEVSVSNTYPITFSLINSHLLRKEITLLISP